MSKSILVISPIAALAQAIAEPLRQAGFRVFAATEVVEAVRQLNVDAFSLIIADTRLSSPGAFALLSKLRRALPKMARGLYFPGVPPEVILRELEASELWPCAIFHGALVPADIERFISEHELQLEKNSVGSQMGLTPADSGEIQLNYEAADMRDEVLRVLLLLLRRRQEHGVAVAPWVAREMKNQLESNDVKSPQVLEMLHQDAGLAFLTLQAVNAGREPKDRLFEPLRAILYMGSEKARAFLLEASERNAFVSSAPYLNNLFRKIWLHNATCGSCAEMLSSRTHAANTVECQMLGLMHNIGQLLILHLLEEGLRQALWSRRLISLEFTLTLFARHQAEFAKEALRARNFPDFLYDLPARSENTHNFEFAKHEANVLYFSKCLARKIGMDLEAYDPKADPLERNDLLRALKIDRSVLLNLESNLRYGLKALCLHYKQQEE